MLSTGSLETTLSHLIPEMTANVLVHTPGRFCSNSFHLSGLQRKFSMTDITCPKSERFAGGIYLWS